MIKGCLSSFPFHDRGWKRDKQAKKKENETDISGTKGSQSSPCETHRDRDGATHTASGKLRRNSSSRIFRLKGRNQWPPPALGSPIRNA